MSPAPRPGAATAHLLAAGPHGGDGERVARALGLPVESVVDLSMSLNPFAPDVAALAEQHLGAVRRYPDAGAATDALARAMDVDPARLVLTNGGSEAIALVAAARGGTVAAEPEFSLHPRGDRRVVWRSNPNNPTGRLADPAERADVWDEAFYPLATGTWSRSDDGAVVVGSLTKLFGCPGLRLGYVLADDAAALTAEQPAWPVNGIALAVLPDLLERADLPGWQRRVAARRAELGELLHRFGLTVDAADAPWVLVHAPDLRARLAPHGVVVRDCASFGWPGVARVAVPDDRGLERLESALASSAP
jgi:histidinol-phosphate/aromatic aminotransferase/cobyric acid decarboxylase-like protein